MIETKQFDLLGHWMQCSQVDSLLVLFGSTLFTEDDILKKKGLL